MGECAAARWWMLTARVDWKEKERENLQGQVKNAILAAAGGDV